LAGKCGKSIDFFSSFDYIEKAAKANGVEITRENVLDFYLHNPDKMNQFRDAAVQEIDGAVRNSSNACLVSMPSVFEWKGASMFGFEKRHVELLNPSFIVAIVDDFVRVRERLHEDPEWKDKEFSPEVIAKWRRSGIDRVWEIAHDFSPPIPVYLIALEHDPGVLFDLLFTDKKRIYLSFAITGEDPTTLSTVFSFAKQLSEHFIVFNPLTIYDWNLIRQWKKVVDKATETGEGIPDEFECEISYPSGPRKYICDTSEISKIIVDARRQIVDRDYKMISAVNWVVVYHRRKEISAGVVCEMVHAKREVKKVYAFYPYEPSPWFEYYCDRIERDEEKFLDWLRKASQ